MIRSLFVINRSNEICLEKHWSKVTPKNVCDVFFDAVSKFNSPQEVPTVLQTTPFTLIHILKSNLFFVAVCVNEVPPLLIIEFLHCITNILVDYFGAENEQVIKDNLVCIYEILDEILDSGFPLATEPNILKELIKPGTLLKTLAEAVTGKNSSVSSTLPTCQLSNVRWRRSGVKYASNEAYFDLIEEINAIVDNSGNTVHKEIHGSIECFMKLSGVPDLTLAFSNHRLIDDASLHPCIRFLRWKRERVLSFIPPDGRFCLFKYHITSLNPLTLPIAIRHNIVLREQGSRFDLVVTPKTLGRPMDSVKLTIQMPASVSNMNVTPSAGRVSFDSTSKVFQWDIGRIEPKHANPTLKGNAILSPGSTAPSGNPSIMVNFSIPQFAASGLKISRVDMYAEVSVFDMLLSPE
ncbi:hypothetical protein AHF37_04761 [Paragonimus kellicotti]|nr:hypothetical protein AHF37_04761 [Paragonimus kellicotti]